jgi:hypothetical protein
MSLRQLRNHAISLSFSPSTLRPVSAAGGDGRIIFGLQSGNPVPSGIPTAEHDQPGSVRFARLQSGAESSIA